MPWTAPRTWVASEDVTAAIFNAHVRDNFNETAPGIASAAGRMIVTDAVNSIIERLPTGDEIDTSETTTSVTYTNLATAGPTVTVTTGTQALVIIGGWHDNTDAAGASFMSFVVSGATTLTAADNRGSTVAVGTDESSHTAFVLETLTAGSNTFGVRYRVSAGTGTFRNRKIVVIPF